MLINAEPSGLPAHNPVGAPLLQVDELKVWFPIKKACCGVLSTMSRR